MTILELMEELKHVYEKYGDGEVCAGGIERNAVDIDDVESWQYKDRQGKPYTVAKLRIEAGYEAMNPQEDYYTYDPSNPYDY